MAVGSRLLFFLLALPLLPSCMGQVDYYAPAIAGCGAPIFRPEESQAGPNDILISAECKKALESVIPYDQASFAQAPPLFQDHVTEAYAALLTYPLAMPAKNEILGTSPGKAGAMPLAIFQMFDIGDGNLNRAVFNYVIGQAKAVKYGPPANSGGLTAEMTNSLELIVYDPFFDPGSNKALFHLPFYGASVLVHEARHADGIVHEYCDSGFSKGEYECDPELNGPIGWQISYSELLLHGSAIPRSGNRPSLLGSIAVTSIAGDICGMIQAEILHPYTALAALVDPLDCSKLTEEWVENQENLPPIAPYGTPSGDPVP